jgi:hypothetical protein
MMPDTDLVHEVRFTIPESIVERLGEYIATVLPGYGHFNLENKGTKHGIPELLERHKVTYRFLEKDQAIALLVPPLEPAEVGPVKAFLENFEKCWSR